MTQFTFTDAAGNIISARVPLGPGQAVAAESNPVVIASNQSAIPVTVASLPLPTGASTSALQTVANNTLAVIQSALGNPLQAGGSVSISGGVSVNGTFWQSVQPVSVASLPLPAGAATEATLLTLNSKHASLGQSTMTASMPVAIASDQSPLPVSGTFWQVTQPISAAALPLPAGAATSAKQPAFGVAGTASVDVLTVQGAATMTPFKTDGSAVTQPISATTLPLPTGASTEATLSSLNTKTPTLGQKNSAGSMPVVLSSDQTQIPVSGTVTANAGTGTFAVSAAALPLPAGAATSALQTTNGTKLDNILAALGTPAQAGGSVSISGSVAVTGTFWQATQAISAASLPLPTGAARDLTVSSLSDKFGTLGQKNSAGSAPVVLASDQPAIGVTGPLTDVQLRDTPVPISGNVNIVGSVATTGTFWQATQPVSVTALPLPSGAAADATVASSNVILSAISDQLPVSNGQKSSANSFPVVLASDQSPLPINISSISLPTGASTEATLSALNTKTPTLGQSNMAGSTPVTIASNQSVVPVQIGNVLPSANNPSSGTVSLPVAQRPVNIWSATFSDVGSSLVSNKFTQRRLGTGMAVSQSSSNLLITTGTNINVDFLARSLESFTGAFINRIRLTLSQRVANQTFIFMMADKIGEGLAYNCASTNVVDVTLPAHGFTALNVGQFICLGGINAVSGTAIPNRWAIASIPDINTIRFTAVGWTAGSGTLDLFGWNYFRSVYQAAAPTTMFTDTQRQGWAVGDVVTSSLTTASPGHIMQMAADGRNVYWADTLVASTGAPAMLTRASKYENIPDPTTELYMYIWVYNGTSAPGSTTTLTVGFVSVEDTVNNPVYLAGSRLGQSSALPVSITTAPTLTVGFSASAALTAGTATIGTLIRHTGFADSSTPLGSGATFTGTGRVTTGGNYSKFNATAWADQAGTLVIDVSSDTGATYRPVKAIALATLPGSLGFAADLSVAVTGVVGTSNLYRTRFINGTTLQGAFQLSSSYTAA